MSRRHKAFELEEILGVPAYHRPDFEGSGACNLILKLRQRGEKGTESFTVTEDYR